MIENKLSVERIKALMTDNNLDGLDGAATCQIAAFARDVERAAERVKKEPAQVWMDLVHVMEADNGGWFPFTVSDYRRAEGDLCSLINAGYFQGDPADLNGDYWQMTAGEETEVAARFTVPFSELHAALNNVFESSDEPAKVPSDLGQIAERILAAIRADDHGDLLRASDSGPMGSIKRALLARFGQPAVFVNNGDEDARMVEHDAMACQHCGGSGHRNDVQPAASVEPIELRGIAEALENGDGFWRSCTGCHELNEGHDTGPYSDTLKCHLGFGCSECGGIGAIWGDTDYEAMADYMAAPVAAQPATSAEPVTSAERENGDESLLRWPNYTCIRIEKLNMGDRWDATCEGLGGKSFNSIFPRPTPHEALDAILVELGEQQHVLGIDQYNVEQPAANAEPAVQSDLKRLRELVDVVWNAATEGAEVPDTPWADRLIWKVFGPGAAPVAAQPSDEQIGMPYGIIDPDYARAYTMIRCTAWGYGYAVGMHGTFTRDLDLILVPWAEACSAQPEHLIKLIAERTGLSIQHGSPGTKPHGRRVWTLTFPGFGDPRWVDLSIMPVINPPSDVRPARSKQDANSITKD